MGKKTIVYGNAFMDVKSGKNADIHVTGIHVDNFNHTITVIREIGLNVESFDITMEAAIAIGFINLDVLEPVLTGKELEIKV
jgi:hypothetical protein